MRRRPGEAQRPGMTELASLNWRTAAPDDAALHALAQPPVARPTITMYLRTDPREPANAARTPAWLVAARNGLRDVTDALEAGSDREARQRWRALRPEVEAELEGREPAARGRSLVWFLDLEGALDDRHVLQVRVRDHLVALGDRPLIAPFIEALDHSRPIGVVLVSGERVRLVHWAHGVVDEAGEEVFDLGGDGWKPYRGPSSATPGRGRSGTTHVEQVEARVEEHRDRFFAAAARATAQRLQERGWERVVIAGEGTMAARLRHALPAEVAGRVVAELAINAVDASEAEIAQRLEPAVEELHRREAIAAAEDLRAGGPHAAVGPAAVVAALAQRQVEHLVLDPYHRPAPATLPDVAEAVLGDDGLQRLPERSVEAAVAADARVTTLDVTASPALRQADGMLAGLRW
jgi:protein required for attachment to host cells